MSNEPVSKTTQRTFAADFENAVTDTLIENLRQIVSELKEENAMLWRMNKLLESALKQYEFEDDDFGIRCPWCKAHNLLEEPEHKIDCPRQVALYGENWWKNDQG